MAFNEDIHISDRYREEYEAGFRAIVAARRAEADAKRAEYVNPEKMAENQEFYRKELAELLGWPMTEPRGGLPKVTVCEEKPYEEGILLRRVQIETLPGLPFYGLMLVPETPGKHPLVICQHGGWGTPEQTADLHPHPFNGYRNVDAKLARRGCVVFAPMMLLWREDAGADGRIGYNLAHNRQTRLNEIRHLGGSVTAVEVYSLMRAIDWLSSLDYVDADRIGMIGASYGGYYTQVTAAVDVRIKAAVSNAYFNDRYAYCWPDYAWRGAALKLMDAEIGGLIAPRAFCIHVGRNDSVFGINTAMSEIERVKPYFAARNAMDKLMVLVTDVDHSLSDTGEEVDFLYEQLTRN